MELFPVKFEGIQDKRKVFTVYKLEASDMAVVKIDSTVTEFEWIEISKKVLEAIKMMRLGE